MGLKQTKHFTQGVTLLGVITVAGTVLSFLNEATELKKNTTEVVTSETTIEVVETTVQETTVEETSTEETSTKDNYY
jgi:hypothetical protein